MRFRHCPYCEQSTEGEHHPDCPNRKQTVQPAIDYLKAENAALRQRIARLEAQLAEAGAGTWQPLANGEYDAGPGATVSVENDGALLAVENEDRYAPAILPAWIRLCKLTGALPGEGDE